MDIEEKAEDEKKLEDEKKAEEEKKLEDEKKAEEEKTVVREMLAQVAQVDKADRKKMSFEMMDDADFE